MSTNLDMPSICSKLTKGDLRKFDEWILAAIPKGTTGLPNIEGLQKGPTAQIEGFLQHTLLKGLVVSPERVTELSPIPWKDEFVR